MLLKFRFSSALGDIFQGILLSTYELFYAGINLESDHDNSHSLEYVHIAITFTI